MPDRKSLFALVHASAQYYRAYLGAREEVWHSVAVQVIRGDGIGLLYPLAVIRTPQLDFDVEDRNEQITEFLERYGNAEIYSGARLKVNESLALLNMHNSINLLVAGYLELILPRKPFLTTDHAHLL